jgi:hypothetical protein
MARNNSYGYQSGVLTVRRISRVFNSFVFVMPENGINELLSCSANIAGEE